MLSDAVAVPVFDGPALVLAVILALYAAVGEPVLGVYGHRWLLRNLDTNPRARERVYLGTIAAEWLWAALVLLVAALGSGVTLADLGIRLPVAYGPLVGAGIGFIGALAVVTVVQHRRGKAPGADLGAGDAVDALLPRTRRERRLGVVVAITAGICEELLFRGLLIALGVSLGLPLYGAVAASCVIFALAHVYQGWRGVLGVGVIGVFLGLIYAATGSLLLPVLLHAALDLREMAFTPRGRRHATKTTN